MTDIDLGDALKRAMARYKLDPSPSKDGPRRRQEGKAMRCQLRLSVSAT